MEQISTPKSSTDFFACFNCNSEVSSDAVFCKSCGSQIKCKICKSLLEEDASFCINCGTQTTSNLKEETGAINNFDYTQKGNLKTIKAKFTNEVGGYFAGLFNNVVIGQPISPRNPFKNSLQLTASTKKQYNSNSILKERANIQDAEVIDVKHEDIIARIFKQSDNGKLEITDNRLKEKSKFDKIKRLSVLYVYAKEMSGVEAAVREELNNLITQEKLSHDNYRKFLSTDAQKYFLVKENGTLSLLTGGKDFAEQILEQIANPDYKPSQSKAGRKAGKKSSNPSLSSKESSESKKNTSSNLSALEMLKKLIKENYFANKRKATDIVNYCGEKKATKFSIQLVSNALSRLIKDEVLDREKKDGQYEYWKK